MYQQLSIFDYIAILDNNIDWTLLEPQKKQFSFPKDTGKWRKIECKVYYPKVNKEVIELYEYKDFTFRSVEEWDPQMGHNRILAWREIKAV